METAIDNIVLDPTKPAAPLTVATEPQRQPRDEAFRAVARRVAAGLPAADRLHEELARRANPSGE